MLAIGAGAGIGTTGSCTELVADTLTAMGGEDVATAGAAPVEVVGEPTTAAGAAAG